MMSPKNILAKEVNLSIFHSLSIFYPDHYSNTFQYK